MKSLVVVLVALMSFSAEAQSNNYRHDEVIVRLNFGFLDKDKVDDQELLVVKIEDLLNDNGLQCLESLTSTSFAISSLYAKKMFPHLRTSDSISIGRQGQKVYMPPFWATFKLNVPENMRVSQFCSDLEDLYPLVVYAHPNYLVETTDVDIPNDVKFEDQIALHPTLGQINHLSMDSAWYIETGEPWIKVGIFDTGIDSTHEDIELLTGWNYYDSYGFEWGSCTQNDHGMKTAGIIGAKRNNEIGIAGIAGGNGSDTTSGVSLIDFKRYDASGQTSIDVVAAGIIDAARWTGTYHDWTNGLVYFNQYYPAHAPGYGIHIGNHSYAYTINSDYKQETHDGGGTSGPGNYDKCFLCRESFLFSLMSGVVNVVSRGNRPQEGSYSITEEGDVNLFPARYDDSWVISVSSSDADGNRQIGGADNYFGYYGGDVDLLAPGTSDIVRTTHSPQDGGTQWYGNYAGTSAAAPHVTGVAALLLSYYNKEYCYSNVNLDPADVEYILQESATETAENAIDGPYSHASGHGRLNAYQALKMIELPKYQIVHPDTLPISQSIIEQDTINIRVASPFSDNLGGPYDSLVPIQNNTDYKVVRYKYQLQYDFSQYIQPSTTLLDTWVRHSQTNTLREHIDTTWTNFGSTLVIDTMGVEPMCEIDSILNDSIIYLSGYCYHFTDKYNVPLHIAGAPPSSNSTDSVNVWYPINPSAVPLNMAFSIYIHDETLTSQYDFPCYLENPLIDSFATMYEGSELKDFELFPNPGTHKLSIRVPENSKGNILLLDVFGRLIQELHTSQNTLYFIDTHELSKGIYFVNYITETEKVSKKWIKQ